MDRAEMKKASRQTGFLIGSCCFTAQIILFKFDSSGVNFI